MRETNTVTSEDEALMLINFYGIVTLFPIKGTQFPSLYKAIKGNRDEKLNKTWTWGDNLAHTKRLHYGKFIRKQVTLTSLELFPYLLRLARERPLGPHAQRILTHLRKHGRTSTTNLRKALGYHKKEKKSEFIRAIDELQIAFAIAIVDREPAPRHTYTYDLIERWMPPALLKQAKTHPLEEAKKRIITQLLTTGVITTPNQITRYIPI